MEILNTTKRPLRVPLPGGKRLFLQPGRPAQISPKARDHAPLAKLIEAGDIEVVSGGQKSIDGGGSQAGVNSSQRNPPGGGVRHTGDR